ncbi:conserved hypothetical protein [Lausannevirus]|uniref:Uncharacterized protein n=1 Tax=Lausannevirus TaxID=999883 RepID=F2WKW3_9VIRU|nr:hypothetical protein LAU_0030 [Lausannevirus]AEA06886.1 conserved hypothetical protein [Lausannevirus]
MEPKFEGTIFFDEQPISFVLDDKMTPFVRCLDIGKIVASRNIGNGSTENKTFVCGKRQRKFYDLSTVERLLRKGEEEVRRNLSKFLKDTFFGNGERKFLFSPKGRKLEFTFVGDSGSVSVDNQRSVSVPEAEKKHPELKNFIRGFLKLPQEDEETHSFETPGFVYVMRDISQKAGEMYKIGKTNNISRRLREHSCGTSEKRTYERVYETGNEDLFERCMHYILSSKRQGKTEMFEVPLPVIEIVGDVVRCIDEMKLLVEKTLDEQEFVERKFARDCEKILMGREAFRKQKEKDEKHKRKVENRMEKLKALKEFVEETGEFPTKKTDLTLTNFMAVIRSEYSNRRIKPMDKEIISLTESIPGWIWEHQESIFELLVLDLQKWLKEHKCHLTAEKNVRLYERLNTWKKAYRNSGGDKEEEYERLQKLFESFGLEFMYNPQEKEFLDKVDELREYIKENSGQLPGSTAKGIGCWLTEQRKQYKKTGFKRNPERKKILDSVHPEWNMNRFEVEWENNIKRNKEFFDLHGHCSPKNLDAFLTNQRSELRKKKEGRKNNLTDEREAQLDENFPGWKVTVPGANWYAKCPLCAERFELKKKETKAAKRDL